MTSHRVPERCGWTGKFKYTESEAKVALVDAIVMRNRGKHGRNEKRYYPCRSCGMFHLTSQSNKERRDAPAPHR
jgi:hypothetical protein